MSPVEEGMTRIGRLPAGRGGNSGGAALPAAGSETCTTCIREEGMPFSRR